MKVRAAVLFALLVQLGLAILGWGGFAPFFAHPPLTALVLATLAMSAVAMFTRGNLNAGVREDRDNRWVLAAFTLLSILLAYIPAYCDRRGIWVADGTTPRWIGVVLFGAGGALRLWPVFVLGERFSGLVAIQRDHHLVTSGPYRHIRNPSYLGLLIGALGWALAFRSILGVVITALLIIPLAARMRAEERLLLEEFGAQYARYLSRSWRLLPGIY